MELGPLDEEKLARLISRAFERGLSLIGEEPKVVVYRYLEIRCSIKKEEVGYRLEECESMLDEIFGAGAEIIKRAIARELYSELGLPCQSYTGNTLSECVRQALKKLGFSAFY